MNVFSWLWAAWIVAFLGIELTAALHYRDTPGAPHTLSATIWWLTRSKGLWHYWCRFGLVVLLAWLSIHMLTGGWV